MSVLHVVDMSGSIYAGSFNHHSFIPGDVVNTVNGYREQQIPTGGTSMLFNILAQYMGTGPIAFVADRTPAIKKEIDPNYKGNRTHPDNVQMEKEIAEYILQDCGFTIYARDGYEADDVIYSIVMMNKPRYNHIYVHTGDRDIYIVVDDKVSILPTSSRAKTVTRETYETTVFSNKVTPYNTVVYQKFIDGDPGKNLKSMYPVWAKELNAILYRPNLYQYLGSPNFMMQAVQKIHPELVDRVKLFYPLWINEMWEIPEEGDKVKVQNWAYEIGNRKIPGRRGDLSAQIKELMQRQLYIE